MMNDLNKAYIGNRPKRTGMECYRYFVQFIRTRDGILVLVCTIVLPDNKRYEQYLEINTTWSEEELIEQIIKLSDRVKQNMCEPIIRNLNEPFCLLLDDISKIDDYMDELLTITNDTPYSDIDGDLLN